MNINDAFPSKYLKAGDLPENGALPVTIEDIRFEEIGKLKERKPVVHFEELDKGMVLNKTNAKAIARLTQREDFEDWVGKSISLYRAEVEFQGDLVEAIRVSLKSDGKKPHKAVEMTQPSSQDDEDEIPF